MLPKLFTAASASQSAPRRAIPLDVRHADALEEALYSSIVGNLYAVDFYEQVGLPMAGSVGDKVPSGYAGFVGIPAEGDERDGAQQPNLSSIILLGNNTVPVVVANSD